MLFYKTVHILSYERGLLFKHGDFVHPIAPGKVRIPFWSTEREKVEVIDTTQTKFQHKMLDVLLQNSELRSLLMVLDLTDTHRALIWKDGRIFGIVGPGRHAFWKAPAQVTVEIYDVSEFRFTHPKLQAILAHPDAVKSLEGVQVEPNDDLLLYRDGVLIDRLGEGLHVFWKGTGKVRWKAVDRREQVADVAGQEIMTSDKVTLRVNLIVSYLVSDVIKATQSSADHAQALYREAQLVLRAAVGTKTLDALLGDKESIGSEVRQSLVPRAAELGITVKSVGLRDIILPGDMKTLLNQVIAATKEAEANLIRRREETAAARSQVNTAKLLADNPHLQRLKELELLKEVLAGTKATFVFGQGDLSDQIRTLVTQEDKT
jgi:regulator of protease activity HflC (stomatin/prohibitin superfamily)